MTAPRNTAALAVAVLAAALGLGSCGALELDDLSCSSDADCAIGLSCRRGVCLSSATGGGTPDQTRDALIAAIASSGATECNLELSCGFVTDTSVCSANVARVIEVLSLGAGTSAADLTCLAAYADSRACIASMSCQQYLDLITNGDHGPCTATALAEVQACAGLSWY